MLPLQGLTSKALAHRLGLDLADARRIVSAVHRGTFCRPSGEGSAAAPLPGIRRAALAKARAQGAVPTLALLALRRSTVDPFVKLAVRTGDGHVVETVRIPLEREGRFSACVSSQAGCALACTFCATGRLGLARNLQAWEIVEQVRLVRATLQGGQRVHGVVFQGMGEPLANVDRVVDAIRVMCDPSALAIDARAITVCTAGLPSGIRRLAREVPRVRLGVSLASARRDVRRTLMPIERLHPLDEVMEAVREHARVTSLAPMWVVTPLASVNDTEDDAAALADQCRRFERETGIRPRISVVPYNAIGGGASRDRVEGSVEAVCQADPYSRGDVSAFVARLIAQGLRPHVRYSGGADIAAACGQLAGAAD
jgi:23S rRNA (adenine2503-C2)-methyltransferase